MIRVIKSAIMLCLVMNMVGTVFAVNWSVWNQATGFIHGALAIPMTPLRRDNQPGYKEIMYMTAARNHINKMIQSEDCTLPLDHRCSILSNFSKVASHLVEDTNKLQQQKIKMAFLDEQVSEELSRSNKTLRTLCPQTKAYDEFRECVQ